LNGTIGPMISVETVLQLPGDPAGRETALDRAQHRLPEGTTIRQLLRRAGLADAAARIETGVLGLSCHGKRAWLDDVLVDGARVEMVEPIRADAKAARMQRVAADRARRRARSAAVK
jgi:putative ubiquitin-RnfH superfamily antitoxin RatB of RatAB toxin-antitoxin module